MQATSEASRAPSIRRRPRTRPGSDGTDIGAVELATLPVAALPPKKFDLKAAIAKCKKKFPKGKRRKSCIKKAKAKAKT